MRRTHFYRAEALVLLRSRYGIDASLPGWVGLLRYVMRELGHVC